MARGKKHTPEQIVNVLRQIEVAIANGKATPLAVRASTPSCATSSLTEKSSTH